MSLKEFKIRENGSLSNNVGWSREEIHGFYYVFYYVQFSMIQTDGFGEDKEDALLEMLKVSVAIGDAL